MQTHNMKDSGETIDEVVPEPEIQEDKDTRLNLDLPEEEAHEAIKKPSKDEKKNNAPEEVIKSPMEMASDDTSKSRCPDCPERAGLKDLHTLCPTCSGTGFVGKEE